MIAGDVVMIHSQSFLLYYSHVQSFSLSRAINLLEESGLKEGEIVDYG